MSTRYPPKPCKCGNPSCMARWSAHYPVFEMDLNQRRIAFLHAAGQDVSQHLSMMLERNDTVVSTELSREIRKRVRATWMTSNTIDRYYSEGFN